MLKVMLVDDEEWALCELTEALRDYAEIVGSFDDPIVAVEMVDILEPDVVFLDVAMPDMDGFQAAVKIRDLRPAVSLVFVTAYSHCAIKAFEVEAVDYVLKPFEPARIRQALARIEGRASQNKYKTPSSTRDDYKVRSETPMQKKIGLWQNGVLVLVNIRNIDAFFVRKNDRQVIVLAGGEEYQYYRILMEVVEMLSEIPLLRCHRSYYVNPASVLAVHFSNHRTMILELSGYLERIPVSRQYRQETLAVLEGKIIQNK